MTRKIYYTGSLFIERFAIRAIEPQAGDILNSKLSRPGWTAALESRDLVASATKDRHHWTLFQK